ncbi:MAG: uroporphyrinogen decarboxylase family protein [Promethearchaeota archaeon]
MTLKLTNKQRVLNIFAKKKIDRIVYSPRLYYWYLGNRLFMKRNVEKHLQTDIPERYLKKSQLELYDLLGASPRYTLETLYLPLLDFKIKSEANIQVITSQGSKIVESIAKYKTPLGELTQKVAIGGGLSGHYTEFPVKTVEDMKIMSYILDNTECQFLEENYKKAEEQIGDRGVVCTYIESSPYQRLVKTTIGFTRTIRLLKSRPHETENFLSFLEDWDNQMYNEMINSPVQIINFGENIDANLSPPPYFEKYLIPYYEKRVKQFHKAGKYCHIHMDGSLKDLLPYLLDLPFDGLEALTPKPQGDVSLEELKETIANKIFLDGIPSILFLPEYSNNYVREYTQKVLETFSPNLILGVSDELSPNGDIRKIEMIADIIKNFEP